MDFWMHMALYAIAFIFIWFGTGLVIASVDRFSHRLKLSSFMVSFVLLGLLTSIPELAVGLTAVHQDKPDIFVGNLLGGIPVLFLCVIPLLAIFGNGVRLKKFFSVSNLMFTLGVIVAPSFFILDQKVTSLEGLLLIGLYILLVYSVEKRNGLLDGENKTLLDTKSYSLKDIFKMIGGSITVFIASQAIVSQTQYLSGILGIESLYVSLIVLSLGTNLPELSLAVRSIISKKKDIAFGDYMGSAAANTFLFGIFSMLHGDTVTSGRFPLTFIFILGGAVLFWWFSRSKNNISRNEGLFLVFVYILFVAFELKK